MKVVIKDHYKKCPAHYYEAAIPLERPAKKQVEKDDLIEFELRNNPTDEDSQTYKVTVPIFESGTPEEVIDFTENVKRVATGQNMTTAPPRYALMRRLLRGDALAAFNAAATAAGEETLPNFVTAKNGLIAHYMPPCSLAIQKQVMRRFMRKPPHWTMHQFMACIMEINSKLKFFVPYAQNQALTADKLLDIGEFGVPPSWHHQMIIQNFDPMEGTAQDLVDFCSAWSIQKHWMTRTKSQLLRKVPLQTSSILIRSPWNERQ